MFNPASASQQIKDEFVDYIVTTRFFADPDLRKSFEIELRRIISKGPFVDIKDVFEQSVDIQKLIEDGEMSPLFNKLEAYKTQIYDPSDAQQKYRCKLPLNRPLYTHQVQAIQRIGAGYNTVITTGTGSGKTECFMIPVLNELLKEEQIGTISNEGIRTILIYPMNALANDQMKRLREILMFYPSITFGIYTGDTKHTTKDAEKIYKEMHRYEKHDELAKPLPNERISREEIKKSPPHILCTNYAMLEHLLLRPDDAKLFTSAKLRFIVLDEAHVYAGATGMETALLLRKLKARIPQAEEPIQFVLTSATLGKKGESESDIVRFACNLCGEKFVNEGIVYGKRKEWVKPNEINGVPVSFFSQLAVCDNLSTEAVQSICFSLNLPYNDSTDYKENLYDLCSCCRLYTNLRGLLKSIDYKPRSVDWFADNLNINKEEFISLIHICSHARKNECSLIDARYHYFIRALEGSYLALDGGKAVLLERKTKEYINDSEYSVFEIAPCTRCGHIAIIGSNKNGTLEQSDRFDKDTGFFGILERNKDYEDEDIDESPENINDSDEYDSGHKNSILHIYSLCVHCGDLQEIDEHCSADVVACSCTNQNRIIVAQREGANSRCVHCNTGNYKGLYLGNEAATAVLATSLFERLPVKVKSISFEDEEYQVKAGKQFLSFSDSRSEAAYFASYMKRSYQEFLRRRSIRQCLQKFDLDEKCFFVDVVDELATQFRSNHTFEEQIGGNRKLTRIQQKEIAQRHAWMAMLNEIISAQRAESMTSLGYLQCRYRGNTKKVVQVFAQKYFNGNDSLCKILLDQLVMTLAYAGAIKQVDVMSDEDKKYIFYTMHQIGFEKSVNDSKKKRCKGWLPRGKANGTGYIQNKRLQLVLRAFRACGIEENDAHAISFLEEYWDHVLTDARANHFALSLVLGNRYCLEPDSFQIILPNDESAHWYKCRLCGRITTFDIDGKCNMKRCEGDLYKINIEKEYQKNHYKRLYENDWMHSLLILEHTAQLSRKTAQEYQQMFEKNEIHALSCSTTFEMGVDVGELETVFLRNIPPSASNYTQRAGRAGRSENAAAYALTYARLSSHDFHYFEHHDQMIEGAIKPPMFKDDNDKVVMRHMYSILFAYFLRTSSIDYYNANKAQRFLEDGGIEAFTKLLQNPPSQLKDLLDRSLGSKLSQKCEISTFGRTNELIGEKGILTMRVAEYKETSEAFQQIIDDLVARLQANSITTKDINKLKMMRDRKELHRNSELIDFFARGNILPKYGFPVDTIELFRNIEQTHNSSNELSLQRDLHMAISEYAPGADVVANDEMYTSRYIKRNINADMAPFNYSFVCKCSTCNTWNLEDVLPSDSMICSGCGRAISIEEWGEAISPRQGMIAEKEIKPVPMTRPERQFSSDDCYIGDGNTLQKLTADFGVHSVTLTSSENDRIMTISNDWYYVCKMCGFALHKDETPLFIPEDRKHRKDGPMTRTVFKRTMRGGLAKIPLDTEALHIDTKGSKCPSSMLYKEKLNHLFRTDVVRLGFTTQFSGSSQALSVMYALLNAISTSMDIERGDISGCIKLENKKLMITLFDVTAGGSGHVKRLLEHEGEVMKNVMQIAYRNLSGCAQQCDTSCYSCLRSYQNQRQHDLLDRKRAMDFLASYKLF